EDQLGTAREVGSRDGKAGQHHVADLEHVVDGGLGGEHGHAGDAGGGDPVPAEHGHDGVEDRIRVAVGAHAVAHALPVGRGLDRVGERVGHRRGDHAGVGRLLGERLARQRQDREHVRDARVHVPLESDRHGCTGGGVGAEHRVGEGGGEAGGGRQGRRVGRGGGSGVGGGGGSGG